MQEYSLKSYIETRAVEIANYIVENNATDVYKRQDTVDVERTAFAEYALYLIALVLAEKSVVYEYAEMCIRDRVVILFAFFVIK